MVLKYTVCNNKPLANGCVDVVVNGGAISRLTDDEFDWPRVATKAQTISI